MPDVTKKMDATQAMGWFIDILRELGVIEPGEGSQEAMFHGLDASAKDRLTTAADADPVFKTGFEALMGVTFDAFLGKVQTVANVAKGIIDAASSEGAKGVSRFADEAPTGTAVAKAGPGAEDGLEIDVKGEGFKLEGEAVALLPGQHLFLGQLPKRKPSGMTMAMKNARANLETAITDIKNRKGNKIPHDTLDKMLLIFDGVITSRLAPPRDSDVLGSDVARQLVNVLSRHPLEAKHWVDAVVSANFERGSEEGSFIIPEAVTHEVMYTEEHVPEEGTTVQTSKAGSFGKARDRYTELTAFMTEYQEILTELARIKPGLFGKGALERLNRRYLTLMEINATDDAGGRERLFKEAKEANVLPYAWPAALEEDDFNMRVLEEIEALNDLLGRDVLDERPQRWRNGRPPAEGVQDLEIGFEESDWLKEDGTPRFETGDGRLLEDIQAELDPMQRLLDLHASALARDIDIIITTMRVVGAKPREAWQACLDDMPGLKEMENMWRPNEKGMEAEGRDKVLERAGLLPGRDTPLLALPASVQGRSVRGNANLLTAGKVAGAIRSAEGAAMMASVKGDGTTALTVVEQYTNKDNTLLQIGALMHELKSAALEGNKAGTGSAIRRLEDLMGRERGALLAEFASGRGRMAEVFGRNFGADARARLADVAGKLDPAGAARGRGPKRDNPLKRGK